MIWQDMVLWGMGIYMTGFVVTATILACTWNEEDQSAANLLRTFLWPIIAPAVPFLIYEVTKERIQKRRIALEDPTWHGVEKRSRDHE